MKPWLAQRMVDRPSALALSAEGRSFDYAQAALEVQRRAARLEAMGIGRGSLVGLLGENSLDWIFCAHAVFWLGATLVPLHPRATRTELDFQLSELALDLVLVDDARHSLDSATCRVMPLSETLAPAGTECAPADVSLDDVLTVLFTSGTTGAPKAVPLTVDNHLSSASASSSRLGLCEDDHWLCCLPLCHVGGLAIALRSAIYGTSFELMDGFSAPEVLETLRDAPVTLASFVPTMVHRLLEASGGEVESTLRAVLVGGGPIEASLLVEARRRGLPALPTYGMTEAATQLATLSPHVASARLNDAHLESAGTPLEGVELRIERPDGTLCASGESGAIWARGPMLTSGYLNHAEANAARFRDGWFRTGDVGRLDADGHLVIEHRKSDLIVTGGENVDPREVEQVLMGDEDIADVAVVGLDDPQWGQVVAALVVPKEHAPKQASDSSERLFSQLEARCRQHLAAFKVPRQWQLGTELPRTASGKVRREQVRSLLRGPEAARL